MRKMLAAAVLACLATGAQASEVFFTLTRRSMPLAELPTSVSALDTRDMESTGDRTVADAVEGLPSVTMRRSGTLGTLQLPALRGFANKQVLVVVDDQPVPPDLTGNVDLSRIRLENVERIEVVRGPASVVYGPNAEGGVIHIHTKRPSGAAVEAQASSEFSSFGTYLNRLQMGSRRGPASAYLTGSRDLSDGFQENSGHRNTALSGRLAYDGGRYGLLSVSADGSDGTVGIPSGTPVPIGDWDGVRERRANDLHARQTDRDRSVRLAYRGEPAEKTAVRFRAGSSVNDRETFQYGSTTLIRTEGRSLSAQADLPGDWTSGYDYRQERLDSNVYGVHRTHLWGAFLQKAFRPHRKVTIIGGMRYDRHTVCGESWSPRVTMVYRPHALWKLSASAGRGFQAPTFADLFNPWVPAQSQADPLRPEVSWQYDFGVGASFTTGTDARVTLFRADIRDRIALDPARSFAAYNLDRATNQGVELELAQRLGGTKHTLNYTYLQAEGLEPGFNYRVLAFSPKHTLNYRLDVKGPWSTGLTATSRYVHQQYTGIGETGVHVPAYGTVGARASKTFGPAELFVGVSNLLDAHYAENADAFNGYYPQPGRTYSGGLTMRFVR